MWRVSNMYKATMEEEQQEEDEDEEEEEDEKECVDPIVSMDADGNFFLTPPYIDKLDARLKPKMLFLARIAHSLFGLSEVPSVEEVEAKREKNVQRAKFLSKIVNFPCKIFCCAIPRCAACCLVPDWSTEGLEINIQNFTSLYDGAIIKIRIVRPADTEYPLPLVYYIHGGGMVMSSAFDSYPISAQKEWAHLLARRGLVVACVDFRNAFLSSENNPQEVAPYPAGLNDCYSGLLWCSTHADELGAIPGRLIVSGDSGGGNLTFAVMMKAKREGKLNLISGFYAICPSLAGTWPEDVVDEGILGKSHLPIEQGGSSGILMRLDGSRRDMSAHAILYDNGEAFAAKDPLAWAGFATVDDLRCLPPGVLMACECDPLLDENVIFYRRLVQANVQVDLCIRTGMCHVAHLFAESVPEVAADTADDIRSLAFSIGSTL